MRVSKNWVKFNKMFTLSPWVSPAYQASLCLVRKRPATVEKLHAVAQYLLAVFPSGLFGALA